MQYTLDDALCHDRHTTVSGYMPMAEHIIIKGLFADMDPVRL